MTYCYDKLWKLLIDKKMLKKDLMREASITSSTMAKMSKNETVSMDVLIRICEILNCNVGDIMDIKKED